MQGCPLRDWYRPSNSKVCTSLAHSQALLRSRPCSQAVRIAVKRSRDIVGRARDGIVVPGTAAEAYLSKSLSSSPKG